MKDTAFSQQFDNETNDSALLTKLRASDTAAYETLVRTYSGRLLAVTRRLLRNEEDARDAVQDAFLSAFRALHTFEEGSLLSTWLHRIAVNAALMKLRTRRRHPEDSIEDLLPKYTEDGHREDGHGAIPPNPGKNQKDCCNDRKLGRSCASVLTVSQKAIAWSSFSATLKS